MSLPLQSLLSQLKFSWTFLLAALTNPSDSPLLPNFLHLIRSSRVLEFTIRLSLKRVFMFLKHEDIQRNSPALYNKVADHRERFYYKSNTINSPYWHIYTLGSSEIAYVYIYLWSQSSRSWYLFDIIGQNQRKLVKKTVASVFILVNLTKDLNTFKQIVAKENIEVDGSIHVSGERKLNLNHYDEPLRSDLRF